jgi:glycosyltransferase involved in cell wall biosynthesis
VCHIVGDGPERHALERQIAGSGLRSYVRLEGAVDEEGVRAFLGESDTFVLPSIVARNGYMDGIPVALMEAMACGVPVIASRLSGIPELVRDTETGLLVPPGSAAAVCQAILRTWSEPRLAALRARHARLLIEREYNLRDTSRQLADAFADAFSWR